MGFETVLPAPQVLVFGLGEDAFVVEFSGREHVENDSRQFVCGGGNRFGDSEFGSHPTIEHGQRRLTLLKGLGGYSERPGNAVLDLSRPGRQHLSAADMGR